MMMQQKPFRKELQPIEQLPIEKPENIQTTENQIESVPAIEKIEVEQPIQIEKPHNEDKKKIRCKKWPG